MTRQLTAFQLTHQASPSSPASGTTSVFAKTGDVLYTRTSGGVERRITPGIVYTFSLAGAVTTGVGAFRVYNDTGDTLTIRSVRASVGTAPTGATLIVDVNVDGTTIFSTQSNRPTIAISGNTNKTTGMSTTTIADGSYFTVDVDQVGSTVAGSNLTVQVLLS